MAEYHAPGSDRVPPSEAEVSLRELEFEADDPDLPVERFMRNYYRHARNIQNCSELVIAQCLARVVTPSEEAREVIEVEEGFKLTQDHLEIPHSAHLRERPIRLLLAFEVAQNHDVPLSRMAQRLIRESLNLIDDERRHDPSFRACFMRILDARHRVMRSLMMMNDIGLLGAFLPEWEHIVCRWQHVIYHTYTVDVHSIFLVEELRRLWRGKYEQAMPELTELMRDEVVDRPALFLGCLLHDIGKGFGGNHSAKGRVRAARCLERLGLEGDRAKRVLFIVEHHLLMSHLAQSRDLSDPKMILELAQLCGDRRNLRSLYLATFADIRASSRDAWTEWKGQLLRELFERAAEMLETGADDQAKAMELIEARVEVRRDGAREELKQLGIGETKVDAFFEGMPRRYFITHTPRQIARHAQVVLRFADAKLLATSFREMRGFTELILCTRDEHGLYAKVTGALSALAHDILGSHGYTSRAGFALEVYRLRTPSGGPDERQMAWNELDEALRSVLAGEVQIDDMMRRRRLPIGHVALPSRNPTRVIISNTESEFYTLVDVIADDRIGLLHDITRCIGDENLEIYISKAATIKDQVTDTFYLKDERGRKVRDAERLERLRQGLLAAAAPDVEEELGGGGP
jgi:[protein-PII] uridylyltransferase